MVTTLHAQLNRALSILTALAVVLMMLHVVVHALSRFLFSTPLFGTNEIVSYWWLPFVALLGIPAAQLQKEHIAVSLLTDRLSPGPAAVLACFGYGLSALVSIGFAWFGLQEALSRMQMRATAGVTEIIAWPVYFLVPVVFAVLAVLFVLDILGAIRRATTDRAGRTDNATTGRADRTDDAGRAGRATADRTDETLS